MLKIFMLYEGLYYPRKTAHAIGYVSLALVKLEFLFLISKSIENQDKI